MLTSSCSTFGADLETLAGTAPKVDAYVIVEQPKPWPRKVKEIGGTLSRLRKSVRSNAGKVKYLATPRLSWLESSCQPRALVLVWDGQRCKSFVVSAEVKAVEEALACESPSDEHSYYLVCTHGSRDRCCGTFGYPVFKELDNLNSRRVLEVSHLGGHRFAPVVVAFPEWRYFGHLTPQDCKDFDSSLSTGRPFHQHYRGHGQLDKSLQVVEAELWRLHQQKFQWVKEESREQDKLLVKAQLNESEPQHFRALLGTRYYEGVKSCKDLDKGKLKTLKIPIIESLEKIQLSKGPEGLQQAKSLN